mgnify:CR=1 FL=1
MSVQLIVYPQSYDGFGSVTTTATNEFASDGINFNTVNASTNQVVTLPNGTQEAIDFYNPTMAVNTWYRYYEGASGVNIAGNILVLATGVGATQQGILQKLSNLTVGGVYNITIDIQLTANTTNAFGVWIYSGNVLQSISQLPTVAGVVTLPFTANSTEDTIVITGNSTIAQFIRINSFSVTNAAPVPSGAIQLLENGQVICDLYEDEDLPLTLSVDDFKNVAEKVQSYSKAFNLPSTKRNNKIFNAIFEVTRENDGLIFNPYKRTKCVLKQDGFILFEGYLRMLDVTDKEGEISYNVNLYSEVIALADTLKDRAFRDLDFTELEHAYNYTNIVLSETGNLALTNPLPVGSFAGSAGSTITNVVRYPFVDWNHQYPPTNGGMPKLLTLESSFRPFISIKYLIDRIFEATPFTYESAFFNTTDFKKLYMDFNWGSDNIPFTINDAGKGELAVAQTATTSFVTIQTNDNNFNTNIGYSAGVYTALLDNQTYNFDYLYAYNVTGSGAWTGEFRWKMVKGGNTTYINIIPVSGTGSSTFNVSGGNLTELLNTGDTLTPEFKSASAGTHTIAIQPTGGSFGTVGVTFVSTSAAATTNNIFLQTLRGELGQWDFLKGLITMFNLVTLVDEDNPNNILIEPYSDVFIPTATGGTTLADRGIEHNWTDKIDVSEMKLTPLTDLNKKTIFKFVEDEDDYAFNQYKNLVGGHLYGSRKFPLVPDDRFNILDGEEEIIAEPFAATVVKPLMSQFPEFIVPAIYTMGEDGVSEGFENSPRIMYNNGQKTLSSNTFSVPAQNGSPANASANTFLQFSHLTEIPTSSATPSTTIDFHFGECQLMTGVGVATPNNLFGLYWLPYYSELYNPNTRTMTLKVNLSPADINTFRFNDRVFIKNRVFRVNKIDYKPNDLATVEFILIP